MQYLPSEVRVEVFDHYKRSTRVGGLQAFSIFVRKRFIERAPDATPEEHSYGSGEILGYYWDRGILAFDEVIFDCTSSGVPHRHDIDIMLARKVVA
jgi:tellurite methyltransferase